MIAGLAVTVIGVLAAAGEIGNYANIATTISTTCTTYPSPAACSSLYVQESTTLFWFFLMFVPFAAGLAAFLFSFGRGPQIGATAGAAAPGVGRFFCQTCKTWQPGPFCPNDGTKLG